MGKVLALVLIAALASPARGDSVVTILSHLKTSRDAASEVFDGAAASLKAAGEDAEAAVLLKWSDDWLSVLGLQRGLTGLTKDFVLNYLGRSSYHDFNGGLVDAIKLVSASMPRSGKVDSESIQALRRQLKEVCQEGLGLFEKDGSLHTMLKELEGLLKTSNTPHFLKGMQSSDQIRKVFDFLGGPVPESRDSVSDDEL